MLFISSNSLLMSNVYACPKMILWASRAVHVHVHVHVDHYFTNITLYEPKWTWWGSPCPKIYLFVSWSILVCQHVSNILYSLAYNDHLFNRIFRFILSFACFVVWHWIFSPFRIKCATSYTCHSRAKQVLGNLGSTRWLRNWVAIKWYASTGWWRGEDFHWFLGYDCTETPHVPN